MRLVSALVSAAAYALGRPEPAPGAASEPAIVEPWRPAAMTDEPDPIAAFIFECLKSDIGARVPAADVYSAYETWSKLHDKIPARRDAVIRRLTAYVTIEATVGRPPHVIGYRLHPFVATLDRSLGPNITGPICLRAIPGLRARMLADAALLSAELLAVLQATRAVLEAGTDDPGPLGDVVRMAAAMLDDAIADAATDAITPAL